MTSEKVRIPSTFDELLARAESYFMVESPGICPNGFHQAAAEVLSRRMSAEVVTSLLADGRRQYPGIQGTFGYVSPVNTGPVEIRKWLLHGLIVTRLTQSPRITSVLEGERCSIDSRGIIRYPDR